MEEICADATVAPNDLELVHSVIEGTNDKLNMI